MKPIRLVCATRQHPDQFMEATALGRSLKNFSPHPEPQLQLFGSNTLGLSTVYNTALDYAKKDPAILVFVHDDIYLCDFFWMERIYEGLQQFDVIGLAGNTRRVPRQPAWAFTTAEPKLTWDERRYLSGTVGHGTGFPCRNISIFGPAKQECKLMDGLFLAADSEVLNGHGVRFDEQFTFHFYDMDFCRQVERKGLRMGTWPIAVVHESGGNFASQGWKDGYAKYLAKYANDDGGAEPAPVSPAVPKAQVYQIFYSEQTRNSLDSGFIPFDNTGQRPDWYEYWPIRNFLLNEPLNEDTFYGLLSPKFKAKTSLSSKQIHDFVEEVDPSVDVVSLSPFFDQTSLFENSFRQGAIAHPNAWPVFQACAELLKPGVSIDKLLMNSRNTIWCNYFLAKPRFWRYWLSKAEQIFEIAEQNNTPLGNALNSATLHDRQVSSQIKVFVMERLVSLLLASEPHWNVRVFNPINLPLGRKDMAGKVPELIMMDALKQAAASTGWPEYGKAFTSLQQQVLEDLRQRNRKS